MNVEDIDEVENLILKYRRVIAAKSKIEEIYEADGAVPDVFVLIDKDTHIEICLHGLKADVLNNIANVLNDQRDKITARLKEI